MSIRIFLLPIQVVLVGRYVKSKRILLRENTQKKNGRDSLAFRITRPCTEAFRTDSIDARTAGFQLRSRLRSNLWQATSVTTCGCQNNVRSTKQEHSVTRSFAIGHTLSGL